MTKHPSLHRVADDLVYRGMGAGLEGSTRVQLAFAGHMTWEDRDLPGRVILRLPGEQRKLVKQLKAEHFWHRPW